MKPGRVLGSLAVIVPLIAILVAAVWFAVHSWVTTGGPPIPLAGYLAMAAGIAFTLIIGVGLMALLFYSHRHGYDDAADRGRSDGEE